MVVTSGGGGGDVGVGAAGVTPGGLVGVGGTGVAGGAQAAKATTNPTLNKTNNFFTSHPPWPLAN